MKLRVNTELTSSPKESNLNKIFIIIDNQIIVINIHYPVIVRK